MRHHFELNTLINTIVGNLPVPLDDFPALLQVVTRQRDLISDEFDELRDGVRERDITEVRDGIADVIVTVDGMYFRAGLEYPRTHFWTDNTLSIEECLNSMDVSLKLLKQMTVDGLNGHSVDYFKHRVKVYCDSILNACYQISRHFGVDKDADQQAVFESNMSKFDTDIEVGRRGVEKYAALGVKTDLFPNEIDGLTYWVIKCTETCIGTDSKKYGVGKFLKSVYFKEPVLAPLAADAPILTLFADAA